MKKRSKKLLRAGLGLLAAVCGTAHAGQFQSLYSFTDGAEGGFPLSGVVWGADNALYGTANNGGAATLQDGTVFRLSRPTVAGAAWTAQALYSFTGYDDGGQPSAGLVVDKVGRLYGTDQNRYGHPSGIAFRLDPPATQGAPWAFNSLHVFNGVDGQSASGSMVLGQDGTLYGTSAGGVNGKGNIFALTPPATSGDAWVARTLYSFTGGNDGLYPHCRLAWGPGGALFGTTPLGGNGGYSGVVFRLAPPVAPRTKWGFRVLYRFTGGADGEQPYAGLVFDHAGAAYGVTWAGGAHDDGVVFQLKQTAPGVWAETVLHDFAGGADSHPISPLLHTPTGALIGTATGIASSYETGELFQLLPPAQQGAAWQFQVLHTFQGTDGGDPSGPLLTGPKSSVIGTTYYGGTTDKGTIYRYTP